MRRLPWGWSPSAQSCSLPFPTSVDPDSIPTTSPHTNLHLRAGFPGSWPRDTTVKRWTCPIFLNSQANPIFTDETTEVDLAKNIHVVVPQRGKLKNRRINRSAQVSELKTADPALSLLNFEDCNVTASSPGHQSHLQDCYGHRDRCVPFTAVLPHPLLALQLTPHWPKEHNNSTYFINIL